MRAGGGARAAPPVGAALRACGRRAAVLHVNAPHSLGGWEGPGRILSIQDWDHTASGSDLFVLNRSIYFDTNHASALGLSSLQSVGDTDKAGLLLPTSGQCRCHSYTNWLKCDLPVDPAL